MAATRTEDRTGNLLLDRLPPADRGRLVAAADRITARTGHEIYSHDGPMPHVHFPLRGVYSVVIPTDEGSRTEAATVGNEGMVGVPVFLGLDFSTNVTIVQVPGEALRVPSEAFLEEARSGEALHRLMQRYTAYTLRYANQTIACNALHSVEERACRWLLMAHDRAGEDEFYLTQEFLAEMLAVRRQSVNLVAATLQRAGFLTYSRGVVRVLNRAGLEAGSCECYAVARAMYDRIMR